MNPKIESIKELKLTKVETEADRKAMYFAASWYIAMDSKALSKKPLAIELFGKHLVAWRDLHGHPAIMERYCSHMGASLAIGEVVDGCIQCPFHHWHFDNSGQCSVIPDVERIPPTARQATYVTTERYGYIWVWYGSKTPMFPLPEYLAAEDENYISCRFANNINTTPLRVLENVFDQHHLVSVHKVEVSDSIQFTLLDQRDSIQDSKISDRQEACFRVSMKFPLKRYMGLLGKIVQVLGLDTKILTLLVNGWSGGHISTCFMDNEERFQAMAWITPVSENQTIRQSLVTIKKTGNFWLDTLYYFVFTWQIKNSVMFDDGPVWDTLNPDGGGAYVEHDRGVLKFREFYQNWINKVH